MRMTRSTSAIASRLRDAFARHAREIWIGDERAAALIAHDAFRPKIRW